MAKASPNSSPAPVAEVETIAAADVAPLPAASEPVEPAAPVPTPRAVLDSNGRLVGSKMGLDADGPEHGDLPTDGTYKFDADKGAFIPLGHGFGKQKGQAPYTIEFVTARLIEAADDAAPIEARDWLEWYNLNGRKRDEELSIVARR